MKDLGYAKAAATAALAGAAVVIALSVWVYGSTSATSVDSTVESWLKSVRGMPFLSEDVVGLASPTTSLLMCAALASVVAAFRQWRSAALTLVGPAAALAMTELVLKPLVHRGERVNGYDFPSGHATAVTALGIVILLAVLPGGGLHGRLPKPFASALLLLAVLVPAAVGAALTTHGYHYATDVFGAEGVAVSVVVATAFVLRVLPARDAPNRSPSLTHRPD